MNNINNPNKYYYRTQNNTLPNNMFLQMNSIFQQDNQFSLIPNPISLYHSDQPSSQQQRIEFVPKINLLNFNQFSLQSFMQISQNQTNPFQKQRQANVNLKMNQNSNQDRKNQKQKNQNGGNKNQNKQDHLLNPLKDQEDLKWKCTFCATWNRWRVKQCNSCKENKFRPYDKMKKDVGNNDYDYLFFIDYECNQTKQFKSEIIEFPVHVVNVHSQELVETYRSFVKPSCRITPFIKKFTKIDDDKVKNAPNLQNVLYDVQNFLEKYLKIGLNKCVIIYDCDSDSRFLFEETKNKNIKLPPIFQRFICLKEVFPTSITNPPKKVTSLKKMLEILSMKFKGQQHSGVDDSRNQALVGIELLKRGYNFSMNQEVKLGQSSIHVNNQLQREQSQQYELEYEQNKDLLSKQQKKEKCEVIINQQNFPILFNK